MNEKLSCVLDIGEQMLIAGAEVHRVEDSIVRMCTALGAARTDVFIITSSMIATVYDENAVGCTESRRIFSTGTDIERLHRLNSLSRKICAEKMSIDEIRREYNDIVAKKPYSFWIELLGCALIVGPFTIFFGGGLAEALAAVFVGASVKVAQLFVEKYLTNKIFSRFLGAFLCCSLAALAVKASLIPRIDAVVIGNIMTLIPGIGFTNAIRDLFAGDSMTGILRLIEAVLIALAIAAGYFLYVTTVGGILL